jgi:3-deoxy-D-manno-octulosonic-acid transferase
MILFLYNVALLLALIITAPWWLWKLAAEQKHRHTLRRTGRPPASVAALRPNIWLHAVSVGEVLAVSRLVQALDDDGHRVVISTTTRTGQALAIQRFGAQRVFYSPVDLPWVTKAHLDDLCPKLLVLAETEFWPNLLAGCFRRNIPVVVVNGRISDRSYPRYHRLRSLWRPFLARLPAVLAQTPLDAERLRAIGCRPEAVTVGGNLKFDVRAAQESEATRLLRENSAGLHFLVAGSTLDGEEAALLEVWPGLVSAHPNLAMILAPRHPERFGEVATLLMGGNISWHRRSNWTTQRIDPVGPGQVLLLDTIGELASVYSLASIAFIGGSLIPAGGHNPLEPAQFGVPIVMGPSYENFRAIVDDLLAHNAIRVADRNQLPTVLAQILRDRTDSAAMGQRAREVFEAQSGATARCLHTIQAVLSGSARG